MRTGGRVTCVWGSVEGAVPAEAVGRALLQGFYRIEHVPGLLPLCPPWFPWDRYCHRPRLQTGAKGLERLSNVPEVLGVQDAGLSAPPLHSLPLAPRRFPSLETR